MTEESRLRPDDACPLFSERLEEHLVAVSNGQAPNRGRFCGHCYTPMSPQTERCPHCGEAASGARAPVDRVPDAVTEMLRAQRSTERLWVTGFAYGGLLIAILGGLAIVLGIPYLRHNLIPATAVYAAILLVGGRVAAGVLGGYYGDRIGYERGRRSLLEAWERWQRERDAEP